MSGSIKVIIKYNKIMLHTILTWLDDNIKKPLEGSVVDKYIAEPLKSAYVSIRKQH